MARINLRNFLTLFRAIEVDGAEEGPEVSQDIQLVYVADDLRQANYIYAGAGISEAAVIGENAIISLQCRNRRGLEVMQVSMIVAIPGFGEQIRLWTSEPAPTITGAANLLSVLRTTGLQGLPAGPLSVAQSGTIVSASIPVTTFVMLDTHGFQTPFFINEGQHFNCAFGAANTVVIVGIRWRELRLFP